MRQHSDGQSDHSESFKRSIGDDEQMKEDANSSYDKNDVLEDEVWIVKYVGFILNKTWQLLYMLLFWPAYALLCLQLRQIEDAIEKLDEDKTHLEVNISFSPGFTHVIVHLNQHVIAGLLLYV